jgi:dienelactone hydrolase
MPYEAPHLSFTGVLTMSNIQQRLLWVCLWMLSSSGASTVAAQQKQPALPDNVQKRAVVIWSEGTRMAGDLYYPKGIKKDDKLPALVLCNGWGGVKLNLQSLAGKFAAARYVVLAFDYRGWGDSDSKLVLKGERPKPDEKQEATVRVQVIREVVDPHDEAQDIMHALDFIEGEPGVDKNRIGIWGTSYGGGLVVWTAAHDDRVKCVVAQVPGMAARGSLQRQLGNLRAVQIARGERDPIPQAVDQVKGLRGTPNLAKMAGYNAVQVADRVKVPLLLIDAEKEELFDRTKNGQRAFEIVKAKGQVPVKYHVVKGITHYGIYREAFEESSNLALEWFNEHLKNKKSS